jgi:hypothetical protein
MVLQGEARVRRVGNGLCVPLPTRQAKTEGIRPGDVVHFIVSRPRPIPASAFGAARKYLKDVDLQALMDQDRTGPDA